MVFERLAAADRGTFASVARFEILLLIFQTCSNFYNNTMTHDSVPFYYPLQDAGVRTAADAAGCAIYSKLNPTAIKVSLPSLLEVMSPQVKPQIKLGALKFLSLLADNAEEEVALCLPEIVPAVTECMTDISKQLRDLATDVLIQCCAQVNNKDVSSTVYISILI